MFTSYDNNQLVIFHTNRKTKCLVKQNRTKSEGRSSTNRFKPPSPAVISFQVLPGSTVVLIFLIFLFVAAAFVDALFVIYKQEKSRCLMFFISFHI